MKIKLYSFDIFDTALTRLVADPKHVFQIMEDELCKTNLKWEGFGRKRENAEFLERKGKNFTCEVTLNEIYERLHKEFNISGREIDKLKNLEMYIENELLHPIPEIKKKIQYLIKEKKRFIYISDIYLPESFIKGLLVKHGLFTDNVSLYLSSSIKKMKSAGDLFTHAINCENIPPKNILHIGDNRKSDHEIPAGMGIKTELYNGLAFSRYEKAILNYPKVSELTRSRLSAVLRYARISFPCTGNHKKTIWNVSVNVSGPLIISFVEWCLERARKKNLTRLYFLARDGQVILRVAEIINKKLKYNIELRYLYASRQALLLPSIIELNDEAKEWILAPTSRLTLRMIFQRVDISIEDISHILDKNGFTSRGYDRHIKNKDRGKVRFLLNDKDIQSMILARAVYHRKSALGYLKQEGLFDDDRYAIVDIGWNGTLQRSISRLMEIEGISFPAKGLYFGIRSRKKNKKEDIMDAFFSDCTAPDPIESSTYIVPMMELFVAADHGGVSCYKSNGEGFYPVLRSEKNQTGLGWGIEIQQKAYQFLAEHFSKEGLSGCLDKELLSGLLRLFIVTPDKEEARVYGSYPDAEEQNEAYFTPIAKKYIAFELLLHKLKRFRHHHNEWEAGALTMSNSLLRKILGL